jgi:type IV pilus assembly protein PilB
MSKIDLPKATDATDDASAVRPPWRLGRRHHDDDAHVDSDLAQDRIAASARSSAAISTASSAATSVLPQGGQRLGDLLTTKGFVTSDDLLAALSAQSSQGLRLGATLVQLGLITERELAEALSDQSGLTLVDLAHEEVDRDVAQLLPEADAKRLVAIPLRKAGERVDVAVADPYVENIQRDLIQRLQSPVRLFVAAAPDILQTLSSVHLRDDEMDDALRVFEMRTEQRRRQTVEQGTGVTVVDENAPVVRVINLILEYAARERASDVHIEPMDDSVRVRLRTDGALHQVMTLPAEMGPPLLSRIKVMSNLNIIERRRPQDGTFAAEVLGNDIDVRVATSPTVFGEMAVLRVLDKNKSLHELSKLGMPAETEAAYRELIRTPYGLVVCAGPTGAGKTTTLYATLAAVNHDAIKVATIEDPVEYVIPTISQIQINEPAGLTFANGLRSILRQDPDTILVGEIRDVETARIAVQAALTGHFVMSSLHATDASAALHRFLDMGIEPFLLASSLTGVVGQRLVRRNCPRCNEPYEPSLEEMALLHRVLGEVPDATFMHGRGCNFCRGSGYFERVGVYEVLTVTDEIRRLMVDRASQTSVREVAQRQGMRTLARQAVELAVEGVTTLHEVMRTVAVM